MTDTHIKIKPVIPKVQYTANGSTTEFPYEFSIFDDSDMVVYVDDEIIESGYTVSGAGQTDGGSVTFSVAPASGKKITLLRNVAIERVTDFQEGGTFRPKNINDELDRQTAFIQQVQETLTRAVKVGPTSEVEPEEVLTQVERVYQSIDNVDVVADDISNVNAVAGNATNINAVAGNESDIDTVAGIASDVSNVASNSSDVSNVATNMSDVNTCATNMAAIQDAPNQAQAASDSAALAQQYGNDKINQTHISNCITDIPQDIKLKLSSGTLTLKAGSKVYVPNGFEQDGTTPKFDIVTIANDVQISSSTGTCKRGLYYQKASNTLLSFDITYDKSGTSSDIPTLGTFYNITRNGLHHYSSGIIDAGALSFPIAIINVVSSVITSIDQVFNGFGYIGSTVFSLPGVKGLIPDGRNEDGSLKNVELTLEGVKTFTDQYFTDGELVFGINGLNINNAYYSGYKYNGKENLNVYNNTVWSFCYFAKYTAENGGKITSFTPKTAFHAVDYNDSSIVSGWAMPSDKSIDLTLGATGTNYTAPANGLFYLAKTAGTVNAYISAMNLKGYSVSLCSPTTSFNMKIIIPAKRGDTVQVSYNATGSTNAFKFFYAQGEV